MFQEHSHPAALFDQVAQVLLQFRIQFLFLDIGLIAGFSEPGGINHTSFLLTSIGITGDFVRPERRHHGRR
jgi:hypothetical protein